jgi:predicted nucleotide-binding protein
MAVSSVIFEIVNRGRAGPENSSILAQFDEKSPTPPTVAVYCGSSINARAQSRVFVTHGKNTQFVGTIEKLTTFGKLEPVVAVEKQSVAKPVPDKVMDEMRSCGAAIIHVDAETTITDKDGKEHVLLNSNVLIEVRAALALYGRRFILVVREGVQLPSDLQGLYEVPYSGDILDAATTIKLLEAITDIQNNALPNRYGVD